MRKGPSNINDIEAIIDRLNHVPGETIVIHCGTEKEAKAFFKRAKSILKKKK
jgi:hypothetical protein